MVLKAVQIVYEGEQMKECWLMFLIGFTVAGVMFQFVDSADLFGRLTYSKKNIIEHQCGGYNKEGEFEWYKVEPKDNK